MSYRPRDCRGLAILGTSSTNQGGYYASGLCFCSDAFAVSTGRASTTPRVLRSPRFPIHAWSSEGFNYVLTPSRRFRRSHRSRWPRFLLPRHLSPKKMSFLTRLAAVAGTCFQSFEEMSCFPCFSKKNIPKEEELVPPVSGVVKEHEPNGKPGEVLSLRTFLFLPNVTHISADQKPLSWYTRMRIAHGAAQGLEYLHEKANPPVIYRDLKSSNILLDEDFNAKLSDSGFARLGPMGDKVHVSSMVMGTDGYCAPEYARTDQLTVKSDVYSFGVVVLELITGRRVIDASKPTNEQNLVAWALPMFRDQKRYPELVDPLLQRDYPAKGLSQAVAVAAMCLQEEASVRPLMADVVKALSFLTTAADSLPEDDVSEDEQSDENSD
ncbi:hypothetical protein BHM03_00008048 [Ensete ventricosum]|nr:hypothetical protein BHM03_00008048 [Ensete ventricosum]